MGELDAVWTEKLNRWLVVPRAHRGFAIISRLGDGIIWYAVMLLLPLVAGRDGAVVTAIMILMACWGVSVYRQIKRRTARLRPFRRCPGIRQGAPVLDEFSFPSGHTLHAVAFAVLLGSWEPMLLWLLIPFAIVTGLARVVLGLHYPSDVLLGALIGLANGLAFKQLLPFWLG